VGKWSATAKALPPVPLDPEEKDRQGLIEERKLVRKRLEMSASELAAEYAAARAVLDVAKEEEKQARLDVDAIEQLISDAFELEGVSTVRTSDGASISWRQEPYAVVTDRAALRAWAMANGHEADLQILWQTANALMKASLEDRQPLPDGIAAHCVDKVSLRKA
jgi:hypothetical protein